MMYTEKEAWQDLDNLGLPFIRTGSREICNPAPNDTDVDFVILDKEYTKRKYTSNGFEETNDTKLYEDTDFATFRRGEVNLIVVTTEYEFKKWNVATEYAKMKNILDKSERVSLFQGVLYGNW